MRPTIAIDASIKFTSDNRRLTEGKRSVTIPFIQGEWCSVGNPFRYLLRKDEDEPVQREFYQIMLKERKEKILDFSMELLLKQE